MKFGPMSKNFTTEFAAQTQNLPVEEYLDFMADMRDIISLYRETFFFQITNFLVSEYLKRKEEKSKKRNK